MERAAGGNNDLSRQMSQFGRGMAEFGRLMAEWGRQMGEAGRQMSQDISRRMTEDISRRMAAEAASGPPMGPAGQATGDAGQLPTNESNQGMGEAIPPPSLAELGRQLGEELGQQMGDYSRQIGDSGRRSGESGNNVVNINVTCSINDVHNGSGGGSPFGFCGPCVPFSAAGACSPFSSSRPCSPGFACGANGAGSILEGIFSGPRGVFDLMTDNRKLQDVLNGSRNNCLKWVTSNDDGGRLVTKITGTGSGDCELVIKNGVPSVAGFPIDTTIPCFTKRYEPEEDTETHQMLVLELDMARFKGDDVRVTPEKGLVNVHIVHVEHLPNGAEMQQIYDVPCKFPEGDAEKDDLISYFSDGEKLTIDIYVR